MNALAPAVEAAALDETEKYLREFVQSAVNAGISKIQMVMMMRNLADELSPPVLIEHTTVQ